MSYTTKDIRNVCLLGHGGSARPPLPRTCYLTRCHRPSGARSTTAHVCDYDAKRSSGNDLAAIAPISFGGKKINVIDCPGFQDFAGEVAAALRAVEAGIIFCTAKDGLSVGAERNWKLLKAAGCRNDSSNLPG